MTENLDVRQLLNGPLQALAAVLLVGALWFFVANVQMDEELIEQGNGFQQLGQQELALKSYQSALGYDSENTEAQFQIAVVLSHLGNASEALAILDDIDRQMLARPARIDMQRGWTFYNHGDVERAHRHFADALESISQDPAAYTPEDLGSTYAGLGWATYITEGCVAALGFFQQAVGAAPDLVVAQRGYEACHE